MTTNSQPGALPQISRKIAETTIRIVVALALFVGCMQILRPFIVPFLWATIIAVAIYPAYFKLVKLVNGRRKLAATLVSLSFLILLIVPTFMLTKVLVSNVAHLAQEFRHDQIEIPLPPDSVSEWPLVGEPIASTWTLAATNLPEALKLVQPQLRAFGSWLVEVGASAGIGMLMFIFAFVIAGILLVHSSSCNWLSHAIARRLVGSRGDSLADLVEATIRSVARGVLGVAVIQALLAGIGFLVAGVPGAGIWALLCLVAATVQVGVGPIVIPAIIYVFATGDTVTAVIFLIWNSMIMVLDNILKPMLLGRGLDVPMVVIFLGAIGGMLALGIVGLFLGAIFLALGYKLFQAWLELEGVATPTPAVVPAPAVENQSGEEK